MPVKPSSISILENHGVVKLYKAPMCYWGEFYSRSGCINTTTHFYCKITSWNKTEKGVYKDLELELRQELWRHVMLKTTEDNESRFS